MPARVRTALMTFLFRYLNFPCIVAVIDQNLYPRPHDFLTCNHCMEWSHSPSYQTTKRCSITIVVTSSRGFGMAAIMLRISYGKSKFNVPPLLSENSRPWDKKWDEILLANRGLCHHSFGVPIAANTGCKISLTAVPALGGFDLHLVATPSDLKRLASEVLQHCIIVESRAVANTGGFLILDLDYIIHD